MKIVKDLGEAKLPESAAVMESPVNNNSTVTTETIAVEDGMGKSALQAESKPKVDQERSTTTEVRKALEVPNTIRVSIDAKNLIDYVGPPIYQRERIYTKISPAGVSTGLGYLGNGSGSVCLKPEFLFYTCSIYLYMLGILQVMPIEASVMPGSGIQLTGKLGEVIRESVQIALSFIKTHAHTLKLTEASTQDLLEKKQVHVHMPEGSIGKEVRMTRVPYFNRRNFMSNILSSILRALPQALPSFPAWYPCSLATVFPVI